MLDQYPRIAVPYSNSCMFTISVAPTTSAAGAPLWAIWIQVSCPEAPYSVADDAQPTSGGSPDARRGSPHRQSQWHQPGGEGRDRPHTGEYRIAGGTWRTAGGKGGGIDLLLHA